MSNLTNRPFVILAGCAGLIVFSGGCFGDPRTTDQGGGSIITAGVKVATGQLASLTPDEIQIIGDNIANFITDAVPVELTNEQAAAISEVLVANDLNTIEDITALIENPGDIVLPEEFLDLFGDFDTSGIDQSAG